MLNAEVALDMVRGSGRGSVLWHSDPTAQLAGTAELAWSAPLHRGCTECAARKAVNKIGKHSKIGDTGTAGQRIAMWEASARASSTGACRGRSRKSRPGAAALSQGTTSRKQRTSS
jgi:hypothetical protein